MSSDSVNRGSRYSSGSGSGYSSGSGSGSSSRPVARSGPSIKSEMDYASRNGPKAMSNSQSHFDSNSDKITRSSLRGNRHSNPSRSTLKYRRRRFFVFGTILVVMAFVLILVSLNSPSGTNTTIGSSKRSAKNAVAHNQSISSPTSITRTIPLVSSSLKTWSLANPISRLVMLPGPNANQLLIFGGLDAAGGSAPGVYSLNTTNGQLTWVANLAGPLHDSSGVELGGNYLLFGGGNASGSIGTVQSLPANGLGGSVGTNSSGSGSTPSLNATVVGALPLVRSDSSAVSVGSTAYVVGGYDGVIGAHSVLATGNGTSFRIVASLPVPVRYAGVVALGDSIYVFGGEAVGGAQAGNPLSTIQQINLKTDSASVVGNLPVPVYGEAAGVLGGVAYLAGGMVGSLTAGLNPQSTIWGYNALTHKIKQVGQLAEPAAHAGVSVMGSTMWIVGGKSTGGKPVASVQIVTQSSVH